MCRYRRGLIGGIQHPPSVWSYCSTCLATVQKPFFFWHMYWWEMESACQDEVSGRCGLHSPHTQPPSIPAFMCLYLPTAYPSTLCAYLHPPLSSEGGGGGVSSKGDKKRPRKRSFYPQLNGARGNPYQIQGLSTEKEPFPSCF